MKKAGIIAGAVAVLGIIAYATIGYIRSSDTSFEPSQAQVRETTTPNSIPTEKIQPPVAEKPKLTKEEALWGMSKEDLMKKFFTYDDAYYAKVDPNRVQQTRPLELGEKRPNIKVINGGFQTTVVGGEAPKPIEVMVPPGMPCTFYAQDLGYFKENGKGCVTAKADERGVVRVHYVSPTTPGGSMIVAHSPEASGWARIEVTAFTKSEYERLKKEQPQLFAGSTPAATQETGKEEKK